MPDLPLPEATIQACTGKEFLEATVTFQQVAMNAEVLIAELVPED
jgi:hypothetical protein